MNKSPLKYGIVSDTKKGFVRVKFEDLDGIVSDWLPVLVRRSKTEKESWQLEVNEHVVCFMDEHLENGVCLGAIPSEEDSPDPGEAKGKFRKLFSDGTLIEYDKTAGKLTVDVKGQLEAKATGAASIDTLTTLNATAGVKATVQAPVIELTGNVVVSGTLTAGGVVIAPGGTIGTQGGGPLQATGNIETTGDVVAGGKSLKTHTHTAPSGGGPTSPPL
jgi:phage baseplate assembly protein V